MGFRCSILGCEYAEQRHEREREQRGEEVVLTVREFEECRHCGDRRLISENTGVTTAPDAKGADDPGDDDPDRPADPAGFYDDFDDDFDDDPDDEPEDDAVLLDGTEAAGELDVDTDDTGPEPAGDPAEELPDEGVEFIDTDPEPAETGVSTDPGPAETEAPTDAETMETEASTTAGPAETEASTDAGTAGTGGSTDDGATGDPDPDLDGEDAVLLAGDTAEGGAQADARTATDAAVDGAEASTATDDRTDDALAGTDESREVEVDLGGEWPDTAPDSTPKYDHGDWPAHPGTENAGESFAGVTEVTGAGGGDPDGTTADAAGATVAADAGPAASTGTAQAGPEGGHDATVEHGPGARTTRTDVAGELHCQACGYSDPPSGTPHRSGDICPDCGSGYLAERRSGTGRNP